MAVVIGPLRCPAKISSRQSILQLSRHIHGCTTYRSSNFEYLREIKTRFRAILKILKRSSRICAVYFNLWSGSLNIYSSFTYAQPPRPIIRSGTLEAYIYTLMYK